MNLKAILFDMVGVLLFKRENYQPKTKKEINVGRIESLYNHTDNEKLLSDIRVKLNLSDKEINDALRIMPDKYEKFYALWDILPTLKEKYKLAIINNGNSLGNEYWHRKYEFKRIFDLYVNSANEKTKKPDLKLYLITCDRLGIEPKDCLFLDDSLENVQGAEALGMKALWWRKEAGKENNLKQLTDFLDNISSPE